MHTLLMPYRFMLLLVALALVGACLPARANFPLFKYPEHREDLRLDAAGSNGWDVTVQSLSPAGGVAYPGDPLTITAVVRNTGTEPLAGTPTLEVVRLGTEFKGYTTAYGDPMIGGIILRIYPTSTPVRTAAAPLSIAAGKTAPLTWACTDPKAFAAFGAYAVIVEVPGKGRQAVATFARVHAPNPAAGDGQDSPLLYSQNWQWDLEQQLAAMSRLGYRWVRTDGFPQWNGVAKTAAAEFDWRKFDAMMAIYAKYGCWIQSNMYGDPADTVTPDNKKVYNMVHDAQYDARWAEFVEQCVARYCGPDGTGPLQIIDFWNEPWEGGGISGWHADAIRYRELYKTLYERAHRGSPHIRVGGASSIMNTADKFFTVREWQKTYKFDILTDHYVQPYACFGPRVAKSLGIPSIETETWIGCSPDRIVATATHFLAAGQSKVTPNHPSQLMWMNGPKAGPMCIPTSAAASQFLYFTAGRPFTRIAFHDHLPWLYQFGDGKKAGFVLAGDRSALNPAAVTMYDQIKANGTITISTLGGKLKAYDVYGNRYPAVRGTYVLPCSMDSVYLEAPGVDPARIIAAVQRGIVTRVKPVEIVLDDFTAPLPTLQQFTVEVHNVLTQPVSGTVTVTPPAAMRLAQTQQAVMLKSGERKTLAFPIAAAEVNPANAYEFTVSYAGKDGTATLREVLHVNTITYGHPTVDGDLADWAPATPVIVFGQSLKRDMTERAWRPWEQEVEVAKGIAEVRFMWDEQYLYAAVRERNKDWKPKPRLSTADDNAPFGTGDTAHTYVVNRAQAFAATPFTDYCFQWGLGLGLHRHGLPIDDAVPQHMIAQDDTDYEYAAWGAPDGGAEIWRSVMPGVLWSNFLPHCRQEGYDGVPAGAKAVVKRDGNDTRYELAIPLADIKELTPKAGATIAMTFALPGSGIEFGAGRSRTRLNMLTLRPSWSGHPSNDIRWGFVKP